MANLTPGDAQEFLPLARVKQELRLDPLDVEQDELLRAQIASATSWVSRAVGSPILDETITRYLRLAGRQYVSFREPYWRQTVAVTHSDGSVSVPTTERRIGVETIIFPPAVGGWPRLDDDTDAFRFDLLCGLDMASADAPGLAQAAILGVRQLFDGVAAIRPDNATDAILRPFTEAGILPRVTVL